MSSKLKFVYIQGITIHPTQNIEKSLKQPNSLRIGNKEIGTSIKEIKSALNGKIDHYTKILITTHGHWNPLEDSHHMSLGKEVDLTSHVLKAIQSCTKGPIQVYIDSCLSGGIEKIDGLHPESIFTTNSRKNEVSFAGMDSQYIHYSQDTSHTNNPYNHFSKMLFTHAANYGRFVTSKGVFELFPDYEVLINPQKARDFLSKEAERFYEFSKDKKWDREYSEILPQEYSKEQIHSFRGDFLVYCTAIGKVEFENFLEGQLRQSNALQEIINYSLSNGITPLASAVNLGHTEIVRSLLENNADPNIAHETGATPLFAAAQERHTEIVRLLLEKNADPNIAKNDGITPLFMAAQMGYTEIVRSLLDNNADPNIAKNNGVTPLFMAAQMGYTEIVRSLLENNADPNIAHETGATPLLMAAQMGYTEIVRSLLENNADPNIAKNNGVTPLLMAAQEGHTEIVELLEAKKLFQLESLEQAIKKDGMITHDELEEYSFNIIKEYVSKVKGWACIDYQGEDGQITNSTGVMSYLYSLFCYSLDSEFDGIPAREIASIEVYLSGNDYDKDEL